MSDRDSEILVSFYKELKSGDPWGDCLNFHFAICDYLHWIKGESTPESWQYKPGGGYDLEPDYIDVFDSVSIYSLVCFGDKLSRLADILRAKGLDY